MISSPTAFQPARIAGVLRTVRVDPESETRAFPFNSSITQWHPTTCTTTAKSKVFNFDEDQCTIFFITYTFSVISNKALPNVKSQIFTTLFASEFYYFSSCKSLIFELTAVYGITKESNFILLYVNIQLPQQQLLKSFSFSLNCPGTLVTYQLTFHKCENLFPHSQFHSLSIYLP